MIFQRPNNATHATSISRSTITDPEFGEVVCKRTNGRYVRLRVDEQGTVIATLPRRAALKHVKTLLDDSRAKIRKMRSQQLAKQIVYSDGMNIGHSHSLQISYASLTKPSKRLQGQQLLIKLPHELNKDNGEGRAFIAKQVRAVLKREAQAYLPRRLSYLANLHSFNYNTIRYGNPKGRWGSCSSKGTISLNVALMSTPHDVIDYVLIHELAHTRHMNHSEAFWQTVELCLPEYKAARKQLKQLSPIC